MAGVGEVGDLAVGEELLEAVGHGFGDEAVLVAVPGDCWGLDLGEVESPGAEALDEKAVGSLGFGPLAIRFLEFFGHDLFGLLISQKLGVGGAKLSGKGFDEDFRISIGRHGVEGGEFCHDAWQFGCELKHQPVG